MLFVVLGVAGLSGLRAAGEGVVLTVSSRMADGRPDTLTCPHRKFRGTMARTFEHRMSLRPGFSARAVEGAEADEILRDERAFHHVSLVHSRLGRRHEFLALTHGGPRSSIRYAARAPAMEQEANIWWYTVEPGDRQLPANAVIDLFGHFAAGYPGDELEDRPVAGLCLEEWTNRPPALSMAPDEGGSDPRAALTPGGAEALGLSLQEMEQMLPIVLASAFAAGVYPTLEEADTTLTLRVGRNVMTYDMEAIWRHEGAERRFVCRNVAQEDVYDITRLMFLRLLQWGDRMEGFVRIGDPPAPYQAGRRQAEPVAVVDPGQGPLVVFREFQALRARSPLTGEAAWQIAAPSGDASPYRFAWRGTGGQPDVYCGARGMDEAVNLLNGSRLRLPASFHDVLSVSRDDMLYAVAERDSLRLFAGDRLRWEVTPGLPMTAGPLISMRRVYYADAGASLVALDAEDGREVWRAGTGRPLTGRLAALGDLVLGVDREGILHAVEPSDGRVRWRVETGDVLLQDPLVEEGLLFVVSGSNRLLAIDPRDGRVLARREWPVWIKAARPVGPAGRRRILCLDIGNRLSFLSWPDLEVGERLTVPHALYPSIVECRDLPLPWGSHHALADGRHVAIVGDERGFAYFVRVD